MKSGDDYRVAIYRCSIPHIVSKLSQSLRFPHHSKRLNEHEARKMRANLIVREHTGAKLGEGMMNSFRGDYVMSALARSAIANDQIGGEMPRKGVYTTSLSFISKR
jgi:hypothetical protein